MKATRRKFPSYRHFLVTLQLGLAALAPGQVIFRLGDVGNDYGKDVCQDQEGNVYTVGYFQGSVDFDPGPGLAVGTARGNPRSPAAVDTYLAKYTGEGKLAWFRAFGGEGADMPHTIQADTEGNLYLTGYFSGTVDMDPGGGETVLSAGPGRDAYVARYGQDGKFVWARGFGNPEAPPFDPMDPRFEDGNDACFDGAGNVYTIGVFDGTIDLDRRDGPDPDDTFRGRGESRDVFVAKHDADGNYLMGFVLGSDGEDGGHGIRVDPAGNLLIAGYFSSALIHRGQPILQSRGGFDAFLVSLDPKGNLLWARQLGSGGNDMFRPGALEVDGEGCVYTAGDFVGALQLPNGKGLRSNGAGDLLAAKWSSSGDLLWANSVGGPQLDAAHRIDVDGKGNVYVAGWSTVSGRIGASSITRLSSGGSSDLFLGMLDSAGNWVGASNFGGPASRAGDSQIIAGLDVAEDGTVAITGRYHLAGRFENPFHATLDNGGGSDSFVGWFRGR